MDNNSVTPKRKTKKIIILLASLLLVCAAGVGGVLAWNALHGNSEKPKEDDPPVVDNPVDNNKNPGSLVLDENGMPEDGSDITETKDAIDSKTLRQLLLADGKFAIELTEDIRIDETLVVNGTKKLVGNKSITMELYAQPFQSVASVSGGATLILDGVTLDGNGIANGVTVEAGAGFTSLAGKILYPVPYGVLSAGTVRIKDITIDESMDTGVCVQAGSKVYMEGGRIQNSAQRGIYVVAGGYAHISNDTLVEHNFYGIRSAGTVLMTGGTLCEAGSCLVYSSGDFTVDYQGKNEEDRLDWYGANGEAGIRIGGSSTASIRGVYVHDTKNSGIRVVNHNKVEIVNCLVENAGKFGVETWNGKEDVELKDVRIKNTASSAVRNHGGDARMVLDNVTVSDTPGFGIKNETGTIVAQNVTVKNTTRSGIWGDRGTVTQVDGATITDSKEFGVENNSATMTLKNVTVTNPARMGFVAKKESVTEIENMTVENAPERGIYNLGGTVTAKDITVTSPGNYGVSTAKSGGFTGQVTVNGLTVTGVKEKDALNCYESVLEVSNGTISDVAVYGARVSKGGRLVLTGVEIKNCGQRGIGGVGGDMTLTNVTVIDPGEFGVTTSKTEEFQGQLTAENLTVKGVRGNALNCNGSVLTVTKGSIYEIEGNGAYVEKGGQLTLTDVEMKDCDKRGVYVRGDGTKAVVTDLRVSNTGTSSIFLEPGTAVEAKRVSIDTSKSYGIFVKSGMFTAQDVSVANTTENGVHVTSSAEDGQSVVNIDGLRVADPKDRGVYNLGGKVTLNNVTVSNPGTYGVTSSKTGEYTGQLNVTDLTVTGVQKSNALNCNGSVLEVTRGTLSGIEGNGAWIEKGGQLLLTDVELKDCAKRGVYVKDLGTKAILNDTRISNTTTSSIFLEPGAAVEAYGVTIDTSKSYGVFVKSGTFTGQNVTVRGTAENGLHVASSAEDGQGVVDIDGLTVEHAKDRGVQNLGGDVTLKNVTITSPGTYGATTSKTGGYEGQLMITGLTVTDVQQNAALNCNASVLSVTDGTIAGVRQNGLYAEKGGQVTLEQVEIADCERRGIFVNNAGTAATLRDVKISNTRMTNVHVVAGATLEAQNLAVEMDDLAERTEEELKEFYGIYVSGNETKVTIGGDASIITRNSGDGMVPENSAIRAESGALTIDGGTYSGLKAKNGSVIFNKRGNVTINGGVFKDNVAAGRGGVIYSDKTITTINGGEFAGNRAEGNIGGGAVGAIGGSQLVITGGYFHENTAASKDAKAYGGGAIESGGTVTISGGTFEANTAFKGGAIYVDTAGTLEISGGEFFGNETFAAADSAGGAIYNRGDNLTITGGTFGTEEKGNRAYHRGGVVYLAGVDNQTRNAVIQDVVFTGNRVAAGRGVSAGVLYVDEGVTLNVENCKFEKNQAVFTGTDTKTYSYGGVMYVNNGTVAVTGSEFTGNSASIGGAALVAGDNGSLSLKECVFDGNTAKTSGTDVRCNGKAQVSLAGKVRSEIALNDTAMAYVDEALTEGSVIAVRIINTSTLGKKRVVVTFKDEDVMNASKGYIGLYSGHAGYGLSFGSGKATVVKN